MSESSFRESIQSNDEDAQVDLGIRVLLTQCFDEMKPFHELDEPLNTLLEVTEMQKEIFTITNVFMNLPLLEKELPRCQTVHWNEVKIA